MSAVLAGTTSAASADARTAARSATATTRSTAKPAAAAPTSKLTASDAVLPAGVSATNVILNASTCPAVGTCFAAGYWIDGAGLSHALIDALAGNRWTAIAPPPPVGAAGGGVGDIECAASDECYAIIYSDGDGSRTNLQSAYVLQDGLWRSEQLPQDAHWFEPVCVSARHCMMYGRGEGGNPRFLTLVGMTLTDTPGAPLSGVSDQTEVAHLGLTCTTLQFCLEYGTINAERPGEDDHIYVEQLVDGHWRLAYVPYPVVDGTQATFGYLSSVMCTDSEHCTGYGNYGSTTTEGNTTYFHYHPMKATYTDGVLSSAAVPVDSATVKATGGDDEVLIGDCASATVCSGTTSATSSDGHVVGYFMSLRNGTWTGTPYRVAGRDVYLSPCVAVGPCRYVDYEYYTDSQGVRHSTSALLVGSALLKATLPPPPSRPTADTQAGVTSCAPGGSFCVVVGYTDPTGSSTTVNDLVTAQLVG